MRRRPHKQRRRAPRRPELPRCVLDSGGLSSLCGRSAKARDALQWVIENAGAIIVPAAILVECTTGDGGRDAEVNRLLGALETSGGIVEPTSTETARLAGALRYLARTDDGIDAVVAAAAVRDGATTVLLTSDPHDLQRLLANEPQVAVIKV